MFKDVLRHMDMTTLTQAALVIFLVVFIAITVTTLLRSRSDMQRFANLPNDDAPPPPRPEAGGKRCGRCRCKDPNDG